MSPADLSLVDLHESRRCLSTFVCLQFGSFQSTFIFIGGGCCSGVLVLWGLSMETSILQPILPGSDEGGMKEIFPRGNNKFVIYISLYHDKCLFFMLVFY